MISGQGPVGDRQTVASSAGKVVGFVDEITYHCACTDQQHL